MLEISTPALVFPALSVLMLAYTNKFIAISKRVRSLHSEHQQTPNANVHRQIRTLIKRMNYIQNMQICALSGFSVNILSIACIFIGFNTLAIYLFSIGLLLVFASLIICIIEVYISVHAMHVLLDRDIDDLH